MQEHEQMMLKAEQDAYDLVFRHMFNTPHRPFAPAVEDFLLRAYPRLSQEDRQRILRKLAEYFQPPT